MEQKDRNTYLGFDSLREMTSGNYSGPFGTAHLYFTPGIEDIRVGYECEMMLPQDPYDKEYAWDKVILTERNGFNPENPDYAFSKVEWYPDTIRTSYLTKEQIEAEGWEYTGKGVDIWFRKKGIFSISSWTSYEIKIQYGLSDKRLRIVAVDIDNEKTLYQGECKSINEFRIICKLLNIK